jgi:predicted enzyme related to lactoylglutathione lyase
MSLVGPSPRSADATPAIAAVLVPVPDVGAGLDWYQRALVGARRGVVQACDDFEFLELAGIRVELVQADSKVAPGAAGTVVYWRVADFDAALAHLRACGATLYRGPREIEDGQKMCQVRDPWGNCIGLRGPGRPASEET